jgi:hypothetical protein
MESMSWKFRAHTAWGWGELIAQWRYLADVLNWITKKKRRGERGGADGRSESELGRGQELKADGPRAPTAGRTVHFALAPGSNPGLKRP